MTDATALDTPFQRGLILFLRLAIGWVFLYAGVTQLFAEPSWSAASFLEHTTTFHFIYGPLAASAYLPLINFCVTWGHLLIGLSLVSGLMIRVSGIFAVILMIVYWSAHLNFPYVDTPLNFLLDEHIVYAAVIMYLMAVRAGHVCGLDGWAEGLPVIRHNSFLRPLVH
jgi:thiosulfate dehydrogenase (quinone) large subunit